MPQLDMSTYSEQVTWLVVGVVFMYRMVAGEILPAMGRMMKLRSQSYANQTTSSSEAPKRNRNDLTKTLMGKF